MARSVYGSRQLNSQLAAGSRQLAGSYNVRWFEGSVVRWFLGLYGLKRVNGLNGLLEGVRWVGGSVVPRTQ